MFVVHTQSFQRLFSESLKVLSLGKFFDTIQIIATAS
jgi:hypothetical protein